MVNLSAIRTSGPTYALDLTTSASAALQIVPSTNDQTNYVSLLNVGTGVVAIEMAPESANLVTPKVATTGTSGSYVLPGGMNFPLVIAAPKGPFYIKAISSGTNTLYICPIQAD